MRGYADPFMCLLPVGRLLAKLVGLPITVQAITRIQQEYVPGECQASGQVGHHLALSPGGRNHHA
jgi:hypothetical protein